MGQILQNRIGASRPLPPGEALVLALTIAAGDVGTLLEGVLQTHGITPRQYNVLRMLRGSGDRGIAHGEIGRLLLARTPDVTRLMDQLVARGWAARVRSTDDARVVLHRLTTAGAQALQAVAPALHARYEVLLNRLGLESSELLVSLCEQLIDELAASVRPVVQS